MRLAISRSREKLGMRWAWRRLGLWNPLQGWVVQDTIVGWVGVLGRCSALGHVLPIKVAAKVFRIPLANE